MARAASDTLDDTVSPVPERSDVVAASDSAAEGSLDDADVSPSAGSGLFEADSSADVAGVGDAAGGSTAAGALVGASLEGEASRDAGGSTVVAVVVGGFAAELGAVLGAAVLGAVVLGAAVLGGTVAFGSDAGACVFVSGAGLGAWVSGLGA
jgi:hypothetical protein